MERRVARRHDEFRFSLSGLPLLAVFAVGSCGGKTPALNLLVWEGYADPSFVRVFEQQYHCKVSASYMGSSDELVAKLRGGSAGKYDVISPSSDVATSIAAAGLAEPLDLVQDSRLQPAFAATHFPAPGPRERAGLGVPFMWGPNPLIYDTTVFPQAPDQLEGLVGGKVQRQSFRLG